ncbi:hypothetical protein FISHEDRAFT_52234, partial [Fistulina hepatica ATCC 64428]
ASPKVLVQILVSGTKILGKAFYEAGRQAVKNAKAKPTMAGGNDIEGVNNAKSGSITDKLTREHRMTVDEAQLILNVKRDANMEQILKSYEHLFKANSPPDAAAQAAQAAAKTIRSKSGPPPYSHYLQSKVVRARDRIDAEMKHAEPSQQTQSTQPLEPSNPPPRSGDQP